jgi:uncharacterized protein YqjF (DUF2071 family)
MHPELQILDHRPWELPGGPWAWRQSWCDLLFAHWPVSVAQLRPLVPDALEIQEFDGTSWIGVVPFQMRGVSRRGVPDLPWLSAFAELNLRLYVAFDGKPGVWFLSLDAANPIAVWAARRWFSLPYFHARMSVQTAAASGEVVYRSARLSRPDGIEFGAVYRPTSEPYCAAPGTLEHWLTERYCLYAQSPTRGLICVDIHHRPWPLQRAEARIERNDLFRPHGLAVPGPPELLHFSRRIDALAWSPCGVP